MVRSELIGHMTMTLKRLSDHKKFLKPTSVSYICFIYNKGGVCQTFFILFKCERLVVGNSIKPAEVWQDNKSLRLGYKRIILAKIATIQIFYRSK